MKASERTLAPLYKTDNKQTRNEGEALNKTAEFSLHH